MKDHTQKYQRKLEQLLAKKEAGTKFKKVDGRYTKEKIPMTEKDKVVLDQEIQTVEAILSGTTKASLKTNNKIRTTTGKEPKEKDTIIKEIFQI